MGGALQHTGTDELLLGTEPLWVVVIGVGVAGDPVTALGALGALMVVSGTLWAAAVDSATVSGPPARRGKPTRSGRLGNKRGSK